MIVGVTLPRIAAPALYTYPARPINGGPFDKAPPKRGTWAAEPKWNGWRGLVHVPSGAMWNRHGKPLSIATEFRESLEILRATLDAEAFKWVDVEALERRHGIGRGTLIVLDVIPAPQAYRDHRGGGASESGMGGRASSAPTYAERRSWLSPLPVAMLTEIKPNTVYLTPSTIETLMDTQQAAQAMWDAARAANRHNKTVVFEGIVMKRTDSLYPIQLRNPDETTPAWVKHRWHF